VIRDTVLLVVRGEKTVRVVEVVRRTYRVDVDGKPVTSGHEDLGMVLSVARKLANGEDPFTPPPPQEEKSP
jgi:hypothetical protein